MNNTNKFDNNIDLNEYDISLKDLELAKKTCLEAERICAELLNNSKGSEKEKLGKLYCYLTKIEAIVNPSKISNT